MLTVVSLSFRFKLNVSGFHVGFVFHFVFELESCYIALELTMLPRLAMNSGQSSCPGFWTFKIYKLVPSCLGIFQI